jgi:hypothetical protein
VQKPLALQQQQCLQHGLSRYGKAFGELVLDDALSGYHSSGADFIEDRAIGAFNELGLGGEALHG